MTSAMKHALRHGAAWRGLEPQATHKSRVVYLTADSFMHGFTAAIRAHDLDNRRAKQESIARMKAHGGHWLDAQSRWYGDPARMEKAR